MKEADTTVCLDKSLITTVMNIKDTENQMEYIFENKVPSSKNRLKELHLDQNQSIRKTSFLQLFINRKHFSLL